MWAKASQHIKSKKTPKTKLCVQYEKLGLWTVEL